MRAARAFLETLLMLAAIAACDSGTNPVDDVWLPPDAPLTINGQPSWSPDGSEIAYVHHAQSADEWSHGLDQVWLYSLASGSTEYLTAGSAPDWSPSGDRIVYGYQGTLWLLDVATRAITRLTAFGNAYQPRWSPDGTSIVFLRWADSDRLWMIAPDGAALRDLGVRSYTADWHPDGTTLVLNTANESRLLTWNIETEGAEPQLLVDVAPARCRYPRWAPDGGSIAYFRWGPGPYPPHGAIRLIGAHGANDRLLIDGGQRSSWSPDGKRLVYEHFDPEQNTVDLWVFSVETGNATPLFTGDPDRPLTAKEESP